MRNMAVDIPIRLEDSPSKATEQLFSHLRDIRKINLIPRDEISGQCLYLLFYEITSHSSTTTATLLPATSLLSTLLSLSKILSSSDLPQEAEVLREAQELSILSPDFGGLGLSSSPTTFLTPEDEKSILFLVSAYLESLNSQDRAKSIPPPLSSRPAGRRGMTLSEKIFAAHDVEKRGVLKPGDMVRVDVDFIMASEISWAVSFSIPCSNFAGFRPNVVDWEGTVECFVLGLILTLMMLAGNGTRI